MRLLLLWLVLLLPCVARAVDSYPSVTSYIKEAERECRVWSDHTTSGRVFGACLSTERGNLFILEPTTNGFLSKESKHFTTESIWGIEELSADANDRFHIDFVSGRMSTPTHDLFRFKLIKGRWRVIGVDRSTSDRCSDNSIGEGSSYSANLLTGKVVVMTYKDCKYASTKEKRLRFHPVFWESFDPEDPNLDLENYGLRWWD